MRRHWWWRRWGEPRKGVELQVGRQVGETLSCCRRGIEYYPLQLKLHMIPHGLWQPLEGLAHALELGSPEPGGRPLEVGDHAADVVPHGGGLGQHLRRNKTLLLIHAEV